MKSFFLAFASSKEMEVYLHKRYPLYLRTKGLLPYFDNCTTSEQEAKVNLATWWCQMSNNGMFIHLGLLW